MKKLICLLFVFVIVFCFAGCNNEMTLKEFIDFSKKCNAEEYYGTVEKYADFAETVSYKFGSDGKAIFKTDTMTETCVYSADSFSNIKTKIESDSDFVKKFSNCRIENRLFDVYFFVNEISDAQKNLGFILICNAENEISYCWFSDPDYDIIVYTETEFVELFEEEFN